MSGMAKCAAQLAPWLEIQGLQSLLCVYYSYLCPCGQGAELEEASDASDANEPKDVLTWHVKLCRCFWDFFSMIFRVVSPCFSTVLMPNVVAPSTLAAEALRQFPLARAGEKPS